MSTTLSQAKRLKDIGLFFIKYGRSDIGDALKRQLSPDESGVSAPGREVSASDLIKDLQALGPTFVKLGQLVSTQSGLLAPAYIKELEKLQDRADPFPIEEVEAIFQAEFGISTRKAFASFDAIPIAAASLSQVHHAVLPSGTEVAVKFQRPGIEEQIREDLDLLTTLVNLLESHTEWATHYGLSATVKELSSTLLAELDFEQEAQNLSTLQHNLSEFRRDIIVPSPVPSYTRKHVLTMEYEPGIKITTLGPEVKLEKDCTGLVKSLYKAYLKQVVIDGFFHMDPHPGNIYLGNEDKLIILDLGMVGRISPALQIYLMKIFLSVSSGRGEEVADILVRMGKPLPHFNYFGLKERITALISNQYDKSLGEHSVGRSLIDLTHIAADCGLIVPSPLTSVGKMLVSLNQVGEALDPHLRTDVLVREYAEEFISRKVNEEVRSPILSQVVLDSLDLLKNLPASFGKILDWVSRNDMKVQLKLEENSQFLQGATRAANRISWAAVAASCIIGGSLLIQQSENPLAYLLFLSAAVIALLLLRATLKNTI